MQNQQICFFSLEDFDFVHTNEAVQREWLKFTHLSQEYISWEDNLSSLKTKKKWVKFQNF